MDESTYYEARLHNLRNMGPNDTFCEAYPNCINLTDKGNKYIHPKFGRIIHVCERCRLWYKWETKKDLEKS